MMVRHAALALACLALAHAIAAPAAFCPKVLEPLPRDMQGRRLGGSLGEALSTLQEEPQKAER